MLQRVNIPICPMGAVRQNRSDAWRKRPAVLRYRAYKDAIRASYRSSVNRIIDPVGVDIVAWLPMPASWSEKKRREMDGKYHRQKPDKDNIEKGVLDALFTDDSGIATGTTSKYWCVAGQERIELVLWDKAETVQSLGTDQVSHFSVPIASDAQCSDAPILSGKTKGNPCLP